MSRGIHILFLVSTLLSLPAQANQITEELENSIKVRLTEAAQRSWELGTRAQTLLELDAQQYSVFSDTPLPPPQSIPSNLDDDLEPVFRIATNAVRELEGGDAPEPLMEDGSAADPASIGVSVLLANWTDQDGGDFGQAAQNQLNFLYNRVPRTRDGAISHRVSQAQLWSDFVYMVPPFLAYFGAVTGNSSLISDSYNQIRLYREYLRDPDQGNLWRHVLLGEGTDYGHWSTGNGWAAMGMLRVLSTIRNSRFSDDFEDEQWDLIDWTREILDGMYEHLPDPGGIFPNYPERDVESDNGNFYDAAGTALIVASTYRFALVAEEYHHMHAAEWVRTILSSRESDGSWAHFDNDGWLTPVVNPHSYSREGRQSAEGQAFVLMMQQAWREWVDAGSIGAASHHSASYAAIALSLASLVILLL